MKPMETRKQIYRRIITLPGKFLDYQKST